MTKFARDALASLAMNRLNLRCLTITAFLRSTAPGKAPKEMLELAILD
jgi:hypothetical protein